jgi:hypothetical protein
MKVLRAAAALRGLRDQPLWRLLAANKGPVVVALLQGLYQDNVKALPGSALTERLSRELEDLRAIGEDMPQTAQAYIADWLNQGWLTRRFPTGASEEDYELSADALNGIRFITGVLKPRTMATESRLSLVIQQLSRLAEETDTNPASRLDALHKERDRIDQAISEVERSGVKALPKDRALERTREVIALAEELTGDFRSVRDEFDKLNRGLRQSIMEHDGSRGDVLEALFAGVDLIGDSDAGRTFNAFWRLLTDNEQAQTLVESLETVISRPFARDLTAHERKFLFGLTGALLDEGSGVHDVLQSFARSLKSFVQSREFLEHRRINTLLKQAGSAAIANKDGLRANQQIDYSLELTSSTLRSVSQSTLYDPAERMSDTSMAQAEPSELTLDVIGDLVRQSEIDFRTLKQHVRDMLKQKSQVSVGEVLNRFPAEQGLGSVVGYIALGAKHGEVTPGTEMVSWGTEENNKRKAKVPAIYFIRERYDELVG